jgi:Serine hydrolase (FSH1)
MSDITLSLPRILCLHGGGVTGAIFRAQFRSFLHNDRLRTRFRFVFVDAPFFCEEGVGVVPVYENWGPFRRWFRWLPEHPEIDADACAGEIEYAIESGMKADAGTGEWVGVLGFSQGAKLAASLLHEQQLRRVREGANGEVEANDRPNWQFGVIMAGRAPLVSLSEDTEGLPFMQSAGGIADGVDLDSITAYPGMRLRLPTVHVHGLQDPGLHLHRRLVHDYCEPGSTTLVEWDGNHRIPLKKVDVEKVVDAILKVSTACGV